MSHYATIEKAIKLIQSNYENQPSLSDLATEVGLSPDHFQRVFQEWAGISPKKFLQYTTLQHAKQLLKTPQTTLFDASYETGLSSTSRLHDLFVSIEGITPGEFKKNGQSLTVHYHFYTTLFGQAIIASTPKGICFFEFIETEDEGFYRLQQHYQEAHFIQQEEDTHLQVVTSFTSKLPSPIPLHLKGTPFQLNVWEALLKIPEGQLTTYGHIAQCIGNPKASRAVGTAIGQNIIAWLIPCHRVIRTTGLLGGYKWNTTRKSIMIGWESLPNTNRT